MPHQKSIPTLVLVITSRIMALSLIASFITLFVGSVLPNTKILAFEKGGGIYLVDVDRYFQRALIHASDRTYYWTPAFSPDSESIAVVVGNDPELGWGKIFMMDWIGKNLTPLPTPVEAFGPISWSPDGKAIIFSEGSGRGGHIYTVNVETAAVRQIAPNNGQVHGDWPAWSPDGERIAFVSWDTGAGDIYLMNADGTDIRRLTTDDSNTYAPSWSPDGKHITFPIGGEIQQDIFDLNIETGEIKPLTFDTGSKFSPVWSPDGTQIAFTWGDYYNQRIYIMDADGKNSRLLTDSRIRGDENTPSWRP